MASYIEETRASELIETLLTNDKEIKTSLEEKIDNIKQPTIELNGSVQTPTNNVYNLNIPLIKVISNTSEEIILEVPTGINTETGEWIYTTITIPIGGTTTVTTSVGDVSFELDDTGALYAILPDNADFTFETEDNGDGTYALYFVNNGENKYDVFYDEETGELYEVV